MTLLEDIQNSALESTSDLGTLLRKCKLLAARLDNSEFEDWLIRESDGYPPNIEVPTYRMWELRVRGHFVGPFGSSYNNASIPIACLPANARRHYKEYQCRQSISSIEDVLSKGETGRISVPTGDLALLLSDKVIENMNCMHTWAEFSRSHLVEVLNSVRNRVLDFSLALWKENPSAGETCLEEAESIESAKVSQILHTTILGGPVNIVGVSKNSMIGIDIHKGNFDQLKIVLGNHNVSESDIDRLKLALETDQSPSSSSEYGPKVSDWIASMIRKAAAGSWKIGVGAAGSLLAQAIAKYYGL